MKSVKTIQLLMVLFVGLLISSCSDEEDIVVDPDPIVAETFLNLYAPQQGGQGTGEPVSGEYIKFSFSEGEIVTGENWDIAFRGLTILVNGGEKYLDDEPARTGNAGIYFASGTFNEIETVHTEEFQQDSGEGLAITTGTGWYNYNFENHIVTPIPGKIIVVRTHDGKYAKMEIISYYKDNPDPIESEVHQPRHYTFNYVYQPNEGTTTF